MFRVHALYPAKEGGTFDFDYYGGKHFSIVKDKCGSFGLKSVSFQRCGPNPDGSAGPYVAIGTLEFDSPDQFQQAFAAAGEHLMADIPNFTNIEPVITAGPVTD